MGLENKLTKPKTRFKKTNTGVVETIDIEAARKVTNKRFIEGQDQANQRLSQLQQQRQLEKTATRESPQPAAKFRQELKEIEQQKKRSSHRDTKQDVRNLNLKHRLDNLQATDKKSSQDIERQRLKLQRHCHHVFNKLTGKCECCGKSRTAHI